MSQSRDGGRAQQVRRGGMRWGKSGDGESPGLVFREGWNRASGPGAVTRLPTAAAAGVRGRRSLDRSLSRRRNDRGCVGATSSSAKRDFSTGPAKPLVRAADARNAGLAKSPRQAPASRRSAMNQKNARTSRAIQVGSDCSFPTVYRSCPTTSSVLALQCARSEDAWYAACPS